MTDGEWNARHELPQVDRSVPLVGDRPAHPDSAPRGDDPSMPLTLATRTQGRYPTDTAHSFPAADRGRSWLARLFAGDFAFPAFVPAPVALPGRAAVEADAVARALGCRDLFVIDSADRTARERLIADLIRSAGLRGERVLALSPDPPSADRIAELAANDSAKVVRTLAPDEKPHRFPPAVARLTSHELGPACLDRQRKEAADAIASLEPKLPPLVAASDALERMCELVSRIEAVEAERDSLTVRRDNLDAEVRADADASTESPFHDGVRKLHAEHDAATAELRSAHAAALAAHRDKDSALEAARHHLAEVVAEASKKHGFLSRIFGKSKPPAEPHELEKQIHALEAEAKDLADREAKLQVEVDAANAATTVRRDRLLAAEVAVRKVEVEKRLAAAAADRERIGAEYRDQIPFVFSAGFGVVAPERAAVERATAAVHSARAAVETPLTAARERRSEISRHGRDQVHRLLADVRIAVGLPASLDFDPLFAAVADREPPFGLLVLDRAEQLGEPDFVHLSRLADRWVLIGDLSATDEPRPLNGSHRRLGRHGADIPFAARLARHLDREPWTVEGDRFVIRVAHLTPEQRRTVTREPVYDRPHIELRVAAGDDGSGILAEVAFPAGTPVGEAKQFLIRELDTVLLRPLGECVWHCADGRTTACWPAAEAVGSEDAWIELEAGIRERIVGTGAAAFTATIDFDPAAGWTAASAEEWLAARLPAAPSGRLAVLPRTAASPVRHVSVG